MAIFNPPPPENISKTVTNAATVTINHQKEIAYRWLAVDFFTRGLHTCTAVTHLPLRQLGFLVITVSNTAMLFVQIWKWKLNVNDNDDDDEMGQEETVEWETVCETCRHHCQHEVSHRSSPASSAHEREERLDQSRGQWSAAENDLYLHPAADYMMSMHCIECSYPFNIAHSN